jgi:hypothetical protein
MPQPPLTPPERGAELLLEHSRLGLCDGERAPAARRLEQALGPELARRLVVALAGRAGERAGGPV